VNHPALFRVPGYSRRMTENQEPAVLVCVRIADMPIANVPSIMAECMECRAPLWRSEGSLGAQEICDVICLYCAGDTEEIASAGMLPSVRAQLLEQGWTIAETEQAERDTARIVRMLAGRRVSER